MRLGGSVALLYGVRKLVREDMVAVPALLGRAADDIRADRERLCVQGVSGGVGRGAIMDPNGGKIARVSLAEIRTTRWVEWPRGRVQTEKNRLPNIDVARAERGRRRSAAWIEREPPPRTTFPSTRRGTTDTALAEAWCARCRRSLGFIRVCCHRLRPSRSRR